MKIEKLPDGILLSILEEISDRIDDGEIDIENPFEQDNLNALDSLMSYFGVKNMQIPEYSFFLGLYKLNPNFQNEPLKRPELKTYLVRHTESTREWRTYYYDNQVTSYLPIDRQDVYSLEESDLFLYYEGDIVNKTVDDSEITDAGIDFIKQIN